MTNKPGRPSKKTKAVIDKILAGLAEGTPLTVICREDGMPDPSTVWDWQQADQEFSQSIAHARERGEEALAEECLEIADDGRNDFMERLAEGGDEKAATVMDYSSEHVQRSKLRIETRLKLLAKFNPKRWGDRVAVDHGLQDNLAEKLKAARERAAGKDE